MTLTLHHSRLRLVRAACRGRRWAGAPATRTIRRTAGGADLAAGRAPQAPDGITRVLVDTSPDLREQLLDANVDWLDGVLITHEHADHTHGIDDLRALFVHKRRRRRRLARRADSRAMHAALRLLLR